MNDERANILLVDDRSENLFALEAILEPLGQNLVSATSGEEALKHLLNREFAVILLDVQMPVLDGFETAALIKERERTRHIPIIFLTAISKDDKHVFRGYSVGAVDYMFKPFEPDMLRSKVSVFIELYQKTQQLKRQAELLREQDLAEMRRVSEERFRNLADAMPQIVFTARPDGWLDYFNQRWFDYTGMTLEESHGWGWQPVIHPEDRQRMRESWERAIATGDETHEIECRFRRVSDGAHRWHLSRALPIRSADGEVTSWVGTATDIEDQKRIEEAQRFLVDAGAVLGSSLDYATTLASVAQLAVPRIADWCTVEIVEEDGSLRQLAVTHSDPRKVELARELYERYPPKPDAPRGPAAVVRSGQTELVADISDLLVEDVAVDELQLGLLRELGLKSYMCVPLVARGRSLGAITFVSDASRPSYGPDDLAVAEELAGRAATAVDNAHLYNEVEKRAQAARVLATVGDGVFLLDREGIVRLWNPAAELITGLAVQDVVGRPAAEVMPAWPAVAPRVPVASGPGPAGSRAETVPLELPDRELWLSIAGVGFDEGTVYAFRDLTEQRALDQLKADFVATVSHELRTPLAAIYGAAVTVRRSDLALGEEMRNRLLDVIADESDRLATIVNDVLLASHLDSGSLQASIESCDAAELVRHVIDAAEAHVPEGISISFEAPPGLPPVAADPGQLRQVLVNLVDNAVKYSPEGGPVEIRLEPKRSKLRFAIRDEGLGIPHAEHVRIFEKFYRVDPNMTRGIGGSGLGLYICRELVSRVNGRIWVESNNGTGSTFYVDIPLADTTVNGEVARKKRASAVQSGSRPE